MTITTPPQLSVELVDKSVSIHGVGSPAPSIIEGSQVQGSSAGDCSLFDWLESQPPCASVHLFYGSYRYLGRRQGISRHPVIAFGQQINMKDCMEGSSRLWEGL